jgi:hypothetical protein
MTCLRVRSRSPSARSSALPSRVDRPTQCHDISDLLRAIVLSPSSPDRTVRIRGWNVVATESSYQVVLARSEPYTEMIMAQESQEFRLPVDAKIMTFGTLVTFQNSITELE